MIVLKISSCDDRSGVGGCLSYVTSEDVEIVISGSGFEGGVVDDVLRSLRMVA